MVSEKKKEKRLVVRNSTAEFLTFAYQSGGDGIDVRVQDGTVWLAQKQIGRLFGTSPDNVGLHLKNILKDGELVGTSVTEDFSVVQQEGGRSVNRSVKHYSLDAIIAVGYRVNSERATDFRRWATTVLRDYTLRGYVLDRKRMENGAFLDEDYFERLLEEIREIRLSERRFYQKITDIFATSVDYDKDSPRTKEFFAKVQNKMHYAVHRHTAAELIYDRADADREHMGLTNWENAPGGRILRSDVTVAKNYLKETEIESLEMLVSAYLDLADRRARSRTPMTMEAWAEHLDLILKADGNELLMNAGRISADIAKEHAESEFEKYRATQDKLFRSDFDIFLEDIEKERSSLKKDAEQEK
jgi:hypothetical protein